MTNAKARAQYFWLEKVLLGAALVMLAWPALDRIGFSDANGYAGAVHLMVAGQRPYTQFLHSHNPAFLLTGLFFYVLGGGHPLSFGLGAMLVYLTAMLLAHQLCARFLAAPLARLGAVALLFFSPAALVSGKEFLGLAELLLGVTVALWGLWGGEKPPRPAWVGLGLGFALACKWMALPWAVGLLGAAWITDRRLFAKSALWLVGVWLLLMVWTWPGAGLVAWWRQAGLLHSGKVAQVRGHYFLIKTCLILMAPALWAAAWRWRGAETSVRWWAALTVVVWAVGLLNHPFLAYYYLQPPLLALWWLAAGASLKAEPRWRLWVPWLPGILMALLQCGQGFSEWRKPPDIIPGFTAMCQQVRQAVPPKTPAFVDSPMLFPVIHCTRTSVWGGMTDNNLYVFDRLVNPQQMMEGMLLNPPVVVLARGRRLGRTPLFLQFLRQNFTELPQPRGSALRVWVPGKAVEDAPVKSP